MCEMEKRMEWQISELPSKQERRRNGQGHIDLRSTQNKILTQN